MNKGQLTIEYLLILVILIMLFTSVSTDLMGFASRNTFKIQTKELEQIHNTTLHNTVNIVALQATGAKQTLTLQAPSDCNYSIATLEITLECIENSAAENFTGNIIGKIEASKMVGYTPAPGKIKAGKTGKVVIEKG